MKIIENKKLFGKINLIDILLLIIIAVVGIFVYSTVFESETTVNIGATYYTTKCTIKIDDLPVGASKYLKTGSDVYDNETNVYIGKLVEFTSGDTKLTKANYETNEFVQTNMPGKETVYLTLEVDVSDQGADLVTANNYYIKVGKYLSVRSNNFAGGGYMTSVDRQDASEIVDGAIVNDENSTTKFTYSISIANIASTSEKMIKVGDDIYDKVSNTHIGKIVGVEVSPAKGLIDTEDGKIVEASMPDRIDVKLNIETEGSIKNGEYLANGLIRIMVGNFREIKTKYLMCSGTISSIDRKEI